jgi:hypothetical protein
MRYRIDFDDPVIELVGNQDVAGVMLGLCRERAANARGCGGDQQDRQNTAG